jgi:surface antigen
MVHRLIKMISAALLCASILASGVALSDPPDHAKAHGWRKKHDPRYVGYTGRGWEQDYGVREGSCNRKAIGTVVGAVIGGVVGSQVGDGDGRTVAIILGSVLGGVIGRAIGEELDEGDRGCIGHALELGEVGRNVRWINERTNVSYIVTPLAIDSKDPKNCRRFKLQAAAGKKQEASNGRACRDSAGVWKMG